MHACPSFDELQNFLDEALDADYIARILGTLKTAICVNKRSSD